MLVEQHFSKLSRYPKTTGTPVSIVEEVMRERGFIDLDDPEQRRKYVSNAIPRFNPQLEDDRQEGIKKAKREHKAALRRLKAKA